jgi:hypothetical protein
VAGRGVARLSRGRERRQAKAARLVSLDTTALLINGSIYITLTIEPLDVQRFSDQLTFNPARFIALA